MQHNVGVSVTAVQVSEAYDLSAFDVKREPSAARIRSVVKHRRRAELRRGMVTGVLICAFVAALIGGILVSSSQLTQLTAEAAKLKAENETLVGERERLQSELDMTQDLKAVEEIAVEDLYLQRPAQDQIVYVDLSGEDRGIVVEDTRGPIEKAVDGVKNVILVVVDFVQ